VYKSDGKRIETVTEVSDMFFGLMGVVAMHRLYCITRMVTRVDLFQIKRSGLSMVVTINRKRAGVIPALFD